MKKVKAVIFDMDGLMFDTETVYYKANQETADKLDLPFDYSFYEKYIGASDADFFKAMYEAHDNKNLVDQFIEQSQDDAKDRLLNETLLKKKGLMELLEFLKENEVKMVVASSTERWLVDALLEKAEIGEYFDGVVGGDEVENSKPDPAIFLKALEKTGVKIQDVLVLEDSLNGVLASHSAGIPVIMVPDLFEPNAEAKEKSTAIYQDLFAVREYIRKFL